jgi:hypothetical protein
MSISSERTKITGMTMTAMTMIPSSNMAITKARPSTVPDRGEEMLRPAR